MSSGDEPEVIETVEDVISQLEYHRETHSQWAEHFEKCPSVDPGELGDDSFHRHVEGRYTQMIEIISSLPTKDTSE